MVVVEGSDQNHIAADGDGVAEARALRLIRRGEDGLLGPLAPVEPVYIAELVPTGVQYRGAPTMATLPTSETE